MTYQFGSGQLGIAFVGDLGNLQRTLDQAGGQVDNFGRRTTTAMRGVSAESAGALGAIDRLANGIKGAFVGSSVAVGLITLKNSVMSATGALVEAQVQVDRLRNGFRFGAGGSEAGAKELQFVREEAQRLGLELNGTASQYMKLVAASRGTSMAGAQTREVFKSIAEASVVMGMNADQNERAMMAVTQMMSKGKVMAEELRGQLGEYLPGAFSIAARAMGVTEVELNKMMETGSVFSADFLPKFAAQLRKELAGSVEESSLSMQANLNRLSTSWQNFKQQLAQSGVGGALSDGTRVLAGDLKVLGDVLETSRKQGDGFWVSLANVSGAAIGRATFGAIEKAAHAANWVLGGFVKNVSLMPDNLLSLQEQFERTGVKIGQATKEYETLSARLAAAPDNIYIKSELGNLARYITALKAAQNEQRNLLGMGAGPASIGSVGSGDTALLRAERAQYEKELAARAALRKKYATTKEKLAEELAAQKALLGSLWSPEEEARIRASFKTGGGGSKKEDSFTALMGRLTMKDVGLDPSFHKELNILYAGYEKGRIGANAYREAVVMLLDSQAFAKDAVREQEEANKAAARSLEDNIKAAERAAESSQKMAREVAQEASTYGMTELQLHQLAQARLADNAASLRQRAAIMDNIDLSGRAGEALRAEADALDDLARSKDSLYSKRQILSSDETIAEAVRINGRVTDQLATDLADSISDGILDGVRNGASMMDIFRNELRAQFARTVLRPIIQPVAEGMNTAIGAMMSGLLNAMGMGATSSGYNPGSDMGFSSTAWESYVASAKGNVFSGPGISAYSSQVVSQPTVFPFARGVGLMGEAGPEAIMPLRRGADGRLGVSAQGGGGNVTVNVINQSGQNVAVTGQRESTAADGSRLIEVFLGAAGEALAQRSGPLARGLEAGYGVRPAMA